jgi:hypothetical protein
MEGLIGDKTSVHPRTVVDVVYTPEDDLVVEKNGTGHDVLDMARMGKIQSLRVWLCQVKSFPSLMYPAQLRLLFDPRILHDPDEFVGDCNGVGTISHPWKPTH